MSTRKDDWSPEELGAKRSGPDLGGILLMTVIGSALGIMLATVTNGRRPPEDRYVNCQSALEAAPDTLALVLMEAPSGAPDCGPYWRAKLRAAGFVPAGDSLPAESDTTGAP